MDPISQASLGAAAALCCVVPAKRIRAAAAAGALAGFLPDADVLIRSSTDPLLFLEYHRQFTHSLLFIPIGAAITAALCVALSRGKANFRELFLPCLLGWASHGLLDSCTSYGTSLFWPLSDERVAWHVISIIDPLFTLPLLFGVIWAVRKGSLKVARASLALALAYLALGSFQVQRAEALQTELAQDRGHQASRSQVKPAMANNILFRSIYAHGDWYYVDAIRVPWIGEPRIYEGSKAPILVVQDFLAEHPLDEVRRNDIERFRFFSAGYLVIDPLSKGVIGDLRYAAVPDEIAPLWGVDVLGTPPNTHLAWVDNHDIGRQRRQRFFTMLRGL